MSSHCARKDRIYKGDSLIKFPDDYTVVDIETTGFSPYSDSVIEISGIKYKNGIQIDEFTSLVRPDEPVYEGRYVSPNIENLTGISHEMLIEAPFATPVLSGFKDFIGDSIIVGHNISFDINFLYDYFEKYLNCYLTNDFVDTQRIAKKLHPYERQTLKALAKRYNVDYTGAHRSLRDCAITNFCLDCMKKEILESYPSLKNFCDTFYCYQQPSKSDSTSFCITDDMLSKRKFDVTHPLYNKVCVFTGSLDTMTRTTASKIVESFGGIVGKSVTRKTNYLILGDNEYCATIKDGKSSKQKRAEELKLEGYDIEIIPENVFLDMITD